MVLGLYCGDGACDFGENPCTCPEDCGDPPDSEIMYVVCHDGLDNDCDGWADCEDPDCQILYADIWPCDAPDGAVEIMDTLAVLDAAKGEPGCSAWCP